MQIACDDADLPEPEEVTAWLTRVVDAVGHERVADMSVRIVDAEESQALNRDFRGQDKATNVLSFPVGTITGLPGEEQCPLGDIVICASVVNAEAEAQGKTSADHWAHMLVHGALHLLGYDHETDAEAATMEALEVRILSSHGVANPYEESLQQT